ncbi:hypothetical protein R6Z02_15705 [Carnobacterium maltaromaticum]|uniref:hypothetical protein n=1 Tax=Lactobacillales TaxID=186826 RepID=UPI00054FE020|nr:hypothetical protein [Carnobacterium maltaromaticum]MDW5525198.1 hypothetical protein [Carnobacterium maltaromaticum]
MKDVTVGLMLILIIVSTLLLISFDKKAFYNVRVYLVIMLVFNVILLIVKGNKSNIYTRFLNTNLGVGMFIFSIIACILYGVFADELFNTPKAARLFFSSMVVISLVNMILN